MEEIKAMTKKKINTFTIAGTNGKWLWMMNYCKKAGIPPAQEWAWNMAELEWEKSIEEHQLAWEG